MLSQIRIRGFKAVKDSGSLALTPLTVLIGRNGAGKSSIIEALQWIQESLILGMATATYNRFGNFQELINWRRPTDVKKKIEIELALTGGKDGLVRYALAIGKNGKQQPVVLEETCNRGRGRTSQWDREIFRHKLSFVRKWGRQILGGNPVTDPNLLALAQVGGTSAPAAQEVLELFQRAAFLRLSPAAIAARSLPPSLAAAPLLDEEGRLVASLYERLSATQRGWVVARIAEIISGTEGLSVRRQSGGGRSLYLKERMRSKGGTQVFEIPSWLLSEGTRRLTALFALLALRPRPLLIGVEEIENGLDPWTLERVFLQLREAVADGVQIILTTHSPFLLDHVEVSEVIHVERHAGDSRYQAIKTMDSVIASNGIIAPGSMYISNLMRHKSKG